MHIEPIIPNFDHVTIRRTGGIVGMDQSLHIDRELGARVTDRIAGDRSFALDAWSAQELMVALSKLAARQPASSSAKGYDLFHYDIELAFDGTVYHIDSVDLGADEALHGVMMAANRLMDGEIEPIHIMSLHTGA